MLNRKYYPFERNSYYFGKLLTTRDFEAEQRYLNDKRRLLNRLSGANGVLSGLGVIMADDTSIILQSGCAFDASGREIVVPETRVVKLSTIEGYGQLTSSCAYLGISYAEQPVEQVYSVMSRDDTGQSEFFNKIQEQYCLNLMDESLIGRTSSLLEDYVTALTVYSDQDITITQYVPNYVTHGNDAAIHVEIKKIGSGTGEYSFCYELDVPGFDTSDGENFLSVAMGGLRLSYGDKKRAIYRLSPQRHIWGGDSSLVVTLKNLSVKKNDFSFSLNEQLETLIKPVERDLNEQFLHLYYGKAMDKQLVESYDEHLWIAKIAFIRQGSSIIIDRVYPVPLGQYCYNSQQLMRLRMLAEYYPSASPVSRITGGVEETGATIGVGRPEMQEPSKNTACGVFELGLGLGYSTKDVILSDEIMHGLGKGPVYVEVGVEYITADEENGTDSNEIMLGDIELFGAEARSRDERVYKIAKAVKVLPERGTFMVAVRLGEASGLISLRIRWYAFSLIEVNKQIRSGGGDNRYILVNPDTIVLPPKGSAHISPVFINMPTEVCSFSMADAEGGTIDNNGVYTAPSKEGVYEIRVEAISDPTIYTHVFAIVSQKKKD